MKNEFRTVGLVGKYRNSESAEALERLAHLVIAQGCELWLEEGSAAGLSGLACGVGDLHALGENCELIITLGGDGTMMGAARSVACSGTPLIGVNLGRVGFLADVPMGQAESVIPTMLQGNYLTDHRALLHGEVLRGGQVVGRSLAVNEVVVHKAEFGRMIEFDVYIGDDYAYRQRSDGLIVATATGSTAYALSAGGPLLSPELSAMVLAPICPHTLTHRPLVISDQHPVTIELARGHHPAQASYDSHLSMHLLAGDKVRITRASCVVTLLHPGSVNPFERLRDKLLWARQLGSD